MSNLISLTVDKLLIKTLPVIRVNKFQHLTFLTNNLTEKNPNKCFCFSVNDGITFIFEMLRRASPPFSFFFCAQRKLEGLDAIDSVN